MTSVEFVRDELLERGYTWASANVKALPAIIDIVANTDHNWQDYGDALEEVERRKRHLYSEVCHKLSDEIRYFKKLLDSADQLLVKAKRYDDNARALNKETAKWAKALDECETAEARDRVRLFRLFVKAEKPKSETHERYNDTLEYLLTGFEHAFDDMKERYRSYECE